MKSSVRSFGLVPRSKVSKGTANVFVLSAQNSDKLCVICVDGCEYV